MRRPVISISSTIVKGSYSDYSKDKLNFMTRALSSLMKVLNQTIASLNLQYIDENQYNESQNQIKKVSNKLSALTNYFRSQCLTS
jgi:four helix bundle protein